MRPVWTHAPSHRALVIAIVTIVLAFAPLAISATPAAAAAYQVPSSIAVDCSVDVTGAMLSWISSVPDGSTLSFGSRACYRIEGTLEFRRRRRLDFEGNGATFRSFNAPEDQRAVLRVWQSTGLTFQDLTIIGSYAHGGTFANELQHAHGIDLRGSNADIDHVAIEDVAGDCGYFGLGSDGTTRSSGGIQNSSCSSTSRNAVSVAAGDGIRVAHMVTHAIGYEVFDVEPNVAAGNWGANDVTFDGNTIGSYYLAAYSIVENAPISHQAFTNNRVVGHGLRIVVGPVSSVISRPQSVTISGNSSDTAQAPPAMSLSSIDRLTVTGNIVPMAGGSVAVVRSSCALAVRGNTAPHGISSIAAHACGGQARPSRRRRLLRALALCAHAFAVSGPTAPVGTCWPRPVGRGIGCASGRSGHRLRCRRLTRCQDIS